MPSSAPSTRRAGFTLLEVIIGATLFSVVLLIALQGLSESTKATELTIAQADLRQEGNNVLEKLTRDLMSTQAAWTGGDAHSIQFYRVTRTDPKFDVTSGTPLKEGGGDPVIYEYSQRDVTSPLLTLNFANTSNASRITNGTGASIICRELAVSGDKVRTTDTALTSGFKVSATRGTPGSIVSIGFPAGLLSSSPAYVFGDAPTTLTIQLVLKRQLGRRFSGELGTAGLWYAYVFLQTQVQLRASSTY